VADKMK